MIAEIYSPPRVTAAARRLPKNGLLTGLAVDITVDDTTGRPWDFSLKIQHKAEALIVAYVHGVLGHSGYQQHPRQA